MSERQPTRGRQRPSIYDVAELAGVSHMTVSRVLNDHPNIRESTRARVLKAIDETNYTRSSIARALATQRAMRIGVVVENASQYGPNCSLRAFESSARQAGYAISVFSAVDDADLRIVDGVTDLVAQGVDALCVIAPRDSSLDELRQHDTGLPTLIITSEPDADMHTAAVDQHAGGLLAMAHLLDQGHRGIAHLAGPLDWFDARARVQAWRDALAGARAPADDLVVGDWTPDSGYEYARVHDFSAVTAIFVANDQMALGVLHGLAERGLRVPQDISVVGFDDVPDSRHFLPPLTTVQQDFAALGSLALRQIVADIDGDSATGHRLIQPRLVARQSTAPPRATAPAGRLKAGAA